MLKENKSTLIIVVAAVAVLAAVFTGWKTLRNPARSVEARKATESGPINPMSSMLGPDASGRPRTQYNDGNQQLPGGPGAPRSHMPGGM